MLAPGPGPVCYGHGGTRPTVTDANLVLGRLDAGFFLGGKFALDGAGARSALASEIGDRLSLAVEAAAEGLLTLTNASLAAAIRLSLFEKGLDPRQFALLSFGGAGGLHAIDVADELGIDRVVFPADASTFSASGILRSDITHDLASSRILRGRPRGHARADEGLRGATGARVTPCSSGTASPPIVACCVLRPICVTTARLSSSSFPGTTQPPSTLCSTAFHALHAQTLFLRQPR